MLREENDQHKDIEEKVKQARIVRKILFASLGVIFIIVMATIVGGYLYIQSALSPVNEDSDDTVVVDIPIGSSSAEIGTILEEKGLIKNGTIFHYYTRYKNESGFQAGEYELKPSMGIDQLIAELKKGKVMEEPEIIFTIPEGTWFEEIISIIATHTPHGTEDIEEVINNDEYLNELIETYDVLDEDILNDDVKYPLEGYLFPSRYDFYEKDPTVRDIIEKMVERTQSTLRQYEGAVKESDYTVHELLTLASIVEREARRSEDRPKIAGVLYNRLEENMKLEVDPSVAYAIGEHQYRTTYDQLEVDSPYNTYKYAGLPPGPIANPGGASIRAVLEPEENEFLFFYARPNGEVIYNENFADHNKVYREYRHEWVEAREENE